MKQGDQDSSMRGFDIERNEYRDYIEYTFKFPKKFLRECTARWHDDEVYSDFVNLTPEAAYLDVGDTDDLDFVSDEISGLLMRMQIEPFDDRGPVRANFSKHGKFYSFLRPPGESGKMDAENCEYVRRNYGDNVTFEELGDAIGVAGATVRNHAIGECSHDIDEPPIGKESVES